MSLYNTYLENIVEREKIGLSPKPIDNGDLVGEIIANIVEKKSKHRNKSLEFLIYNILPGTTEAALSKSHFLKDIILGKIKINEVTQSLAFELLSHMKGGSSIKVLIDLALSDSSTIIKKAANILKKQVFLYDSDIERLQIAYKKGNITAKEILTSYSKAEFFSKLPGIEREIKVVTYVAGEGDISTDLLSPGNQAHSRADRELHGKCMISEEAQSEIKELQNKNPDKRIMLIAEKGTMGVGSSRMSGINNVALLTGKKISPYIPFVNYAPIVAGTNGISPIFLTTVSVTGGIGINLKNWSKKLDSEEKIILNNDGNPILEQNYSVDTGTILIINTKKKETL